MKKITIVLISLLVLLGSISVVYGSEDQLKFTDVKKSDYYYNSVVWALNNKVTDGTSNTTFSPDATCTRAQVVTFLWRSMGQPEPISTVNKFSDVSETDWFYKPVLWAVEKGITDGTSLTTFSPSDKCRNSHILVFIYRAIGQPYYYDSDNWYNAALTWARNVRLINGTFEGEYDINAYSTRASVVEYLFRYEQVKQGTFKPPVFIDGNIVRFIKDAAIYNGPGFEYEHVISESGELGISPGHQLIVKAGNLGYIRDYVMKENGVWYNVGPSLSSENHQKIKRDWWVFDDGSVIIDRTMHEAVILALDLDGGVDFDADTPFAIAIYEGSLNITIIAEDNDHYYWHYHCYKDHLLSQSKSDKESIAIFHKSLGDLLIELYGRVGTTINIDNLSYPEHVSDTIEIIDNSTGNITNGLSFTIEIDNDITEFWAVPVNGTEEYDYYVVTSDDLNGNRYAAPWSLYRDRK